jgi:flagellar protein FlaG
MSMEITGIVGQRTAAARVPGDIPVSTARPSQAPTARVTTADALNKRLSFSVNRELDQVVVKVIDRSTDKVIKELPPEELQRMHVRIREAIGLLIDEEI